MTGDLFAPAIVGHARQAVDVISPILQASTEYSSLGQGLNETILLWPEEARRLYGSEPERVVGKFNSSILSIPEAVAAAGKPQEVLAAALYDGKGEGRFTRLRKNRVRFTARVIIIPRRDRPDHWFPANHREQHRRVAVAHQ